MELQEGATPYSYMTFGCIIKICDYNMRGRCIYNVAKLKIPTGRHCHADIVEVENEARLDYLDGNLT